MKKLISFILAILLITSIQIYSQNKYVGLKTCIACHKGEKRKMICENWLKTKHSQSFNFLNSEKSKEIAKKLKLSSDPTESIECLKCHFTGYFPDEFTMPTKKRRWCYMRSMSWLIISIQNKKCKREI